MHTGSTTLSRPRPMPPPFATIISVGGQIRNGLGGGACNETGCKHTLTTSNTSQKNWTPLCFSVLMNFRTDIQHKPFIIKTSRYIFIVVVPIRVSTYDTCFSYIEEFSITFSPNMACKSITYVCVCMCVRAHTHTNTPGLWRGISRNKTITTADNLPHRKRTRKIYLKARVSTQLLIQHTVDMREARRRPPTPQTLDQSPAGPPIRFRTEVKLENAFKLRGNGRPANGACAKKKFLFLFFLLLSQHV